MADAIDDVLDTLAKDVEAAVHALYRGDVRQATAQARYGHLIREATDALRARGAAPTAPSEHGGSPHASVAAPPSAAGAGVGWSREEGEAVMKCVMAWLPMGSPVSATPDSRCVAAGREMVPTWGDREQARAALRKLTTA